MSEFLTSFVAQSQARQEKAPAWLQGIREEAAEKLAGLSVPTRKDEEWRFLKLKPLVESTWPAAWHAAINPDGVVAERAIAEAEGARLVFVNGRFSDELSDLSGLPEAVTVKALSQVSDEDEIAAVTDYLGGHDFWAEDVFLNINAANVEDGAVVMIPRNVTVEPVIHVLFVSTGSEAGAPQARNVIVAGESASFTLVEEYVSAGDGAYFQNTVNDVFIGSNASVHHFKVQREGAEAFHVARNQISLGRDCNYMSTAVNFGALLSRNDSYARYDGVNVDCNLDGLAFLHGEQVSDTHTAIDHALPDSRSYQLHKVIVADRSHSVFNGKIFVRQDAQRTRSEQLNQNLLLSRGSHVDTKPQLEILADDVVCAHGATVGQLEDDHFFYLRSRGLNEDQARALLTFAFAAEVLETITVESLRRSLEQEVLRATSGEELA